MGIILSGTGGRERRGVNRSATSTATSLSALAIASACNVEGGPVIDRCADDGQASATLTRG
jgi:hypothetical protein